MKRVTCINPKNYSLTRDREYDAETVESRRGYYSIINDAGRQANYASDLFEDVPEDTSVRNITAQRDGMTILITFTQGNTNRRMSIPRLDGIETNISCGILQLTGVNNTFDYIQNYFSTRDFSQEEKSALIAHYFATLFETMDEECGMVILSTNINADSFETSNLYLSDMAITSHETHNPNSGNRIKLWVIDVNDLLDDEDTE